MNTRLEVFKISCVNYIPELLGMNLIELEQYKAKHNQFHQWQNLTISR